MAASLYTKPSAADLAALDEALTDFDLSSTTSIGALAPAAIAPLILVSAAPASVAPAVMTTPSTELEAFYKSMDKVQAEELQTAAARIKERDRAARIGIIETGNDLIAIKNGIPGQFDRWLKVEFDMSKATAWNYINAALQFSSAPKVVEILPIGTVYKLAAKVTPAAVRETVVAEIESGAVLSKDDVERRIAEALTLAAAEVRARKQAEREQAEADRQKLEDEKAWQLRARELGDAGRTEAEVKNARQKWDHTNEAKLRARERAKQKRKDEEKKRAEKWTAEKENERQNAKRIANWLLASLGPDKFEIFRSELSKASQWDVISMVKEMDPASIDTAHIAVAEEKAMTEAAVSEAGTVSLVFGSF